MYTLCNSVHFVLALLVPGVKLRPKLLEETFNSRGRADVSAFPAEPDRAPPKGAGAIA